MSKPDKLITLTELAEQMEDSGLLALGEPYVEYFIAANKEQINIFLTHPKHGTHCVLASGCLDNNPTLVRKAMFGASENQNSESPTLLSDFIATNQKRKAAITLNELAISEAMFYVGKESRKKRLTWLLANQILDKDSHQSSNALNRKNKVTSIINNIGTAIGRPEQVAYLSRYDNLSKDHIKELITLPMDWLSKSLLPPENFLSITLPVFSNPSPFSPTERKQITLT